MQTKNRTYFWIFSADYVLLNMKSSSDLPMESPVSKMHHLNMLCMFFTDYYWICSRSVFLLHLLLYNSTSDWITSEVCNIISCDILTEIVDVIYYIRFRWITCGFMLLSTFQIETKMQKGIEWG